jgi:hypothetical protein
MAKEAQQNPKGEHVLQPMDRAGRSRPSMTKDPEASIPTCHGGRCLQRVGTCARRTMRPMRWCVTVHHGIHLGNEAFNHPVTRRLGFCALSSLPAMHGRHCR